MEIAPTLHFLIRNNLPVDVLITGVGLPVTMYAITKSVCKQRPDYILQAGLAGSFPQNLLPGGVVVIKSDTIGDLGVKEKEGFRSVFEMGFADKNRPPWHEGRLTNPLKDYSTAGLQIVDAVTVNEITTDVERINYYRNKLGAVVETMEGAALHYTAMMEKIPFLQIRAISNYAGERDKTKWQMQEAITNLNSEVQHSIKNYFSI